MKQTVKDFCRYAVWGIPAVIFLAFLLLFRPVLRASVNVTNLEDGLYSMEYKGDYGFDEFLSQGGAASDPAAADFVIRQVFHGWIDLNLESSSFGCSTISAPADGRQSFGRNFDWGAVHH